MGEKERNRLHAYCLLDEYERTGQVVKDSICPFPPHPACLSLVNMRGIETLDKSVSKRYLPSC